MKTKFLPLFSILLLLPILSYPQTPLTAGASLDLGFSPGGTSLEVVLKAISSAKSTLLVAAYEFTSREIAEALESAAHRGVKVRIVADFKASKDKYSQILLGSMNGMRSTTTSSWLLIQAPLRLGASTIHQVQSSGMRRMPWSFGMYRILPQSTRGNGRGFGGNPNRPYKLPFKGVENGDR